jgi:hypothetical protein
MMTIYYYILLPTLHRVIKNRIIILYTYKLNFRIS